MWKVSFMNAKFLLITSIFLSSAIYTGDSASFDDGIEVYKEYHKNGNIKNVTQYNKNLNIKASVGYYDKDSKVSKISTYYNDKLMSEIIASKVGKAKCMKVYHLNINFLKYNENKEEFDFNIPTTKEISDFKDSINDKDLRLDILCNQNDISFFMVYSGGFFDTPSFTGGVFTKNGEQRNITKMVEAENIINEYYREDKLMIFGIDTGY